MTHTEERISKAVNTAIMMAKIEVRMGRIESAEAIIAPVYAKVADQTRGVSAAFIGERITVLRNFAYQNDLTIR